MKVLLYFEKINALKKSGIGKALQHQTEALRFAGVDFTTNPKDDFDLVHINTTLNESKRFLKMCNKKHIPVIVHGHSTFEDFRNSFAFWRLMTIWFYPQLKYMYKHAGIIITPTLYSKKLIEGYGYNKKVYAVSNGIDLKDFKYNADYVEEFKSYFHIKDGEKVVFGSGLLFERKGLHDFIEIARSFPDVKFIWFGNLSKWLTTRKIRKAIKHKPENVILPGYISNGVYRGAFFYASCLLCTTYEETECIVVLESLASRCPIVTRNIGVFVPWLVDNKNCLKAKNNGEFIEKIKIALDSDLTYLTEEGYKTIQERSLDKVGLQLREIYMNYYKEFKTK